jgi:glycosyltransferase involved in cell wall biosynthesis
MGMDHAQGEIIAFPDDDCWYPPYLMERVSGWFDANPSYEILSVTSRDANGECSCNGWFQHSCDLNDLNIFRTSGGSCYFIHSSRIAQTVRYDECIGPGSNSPYLCGEDTDFLLTAIRMGAHGRFEAKWNIGHPRKDIRGASVSKERVYGFGQGMGFVQRKHRMGWLWALFIAYDYGRALWFYPIGRRVQAALWWRHARGLMAGYLCAYAKL